MGCIFAVWVAFLCIRVVYVLKCDIVIKVFPVLVWTKRRVKKDAPV